MELIWAKREAKYFLRTDWTVDSALIGLAKFDFWRKSILGSRTRCSVLPAMPTGRANARPMTGSASSGALLRRDLSRKDGPRISSATRALRRVRGTQQRHSSFRGASVMSEPENLFLLALLWRSKTVNHNLVCRGAVGRFALW